MQTHGWGKQYRTSRERTRSHGGHRNSAKSSSSGRLPAREHMEERRGGVLPFLRESMVDRTMAFARVTRLSRMKRRECWWPRQKPQSAVFAPATWGVGCSGVGHANKVRRWVRGPTGISALNGGDHRSRKCPEGGGCFWCSGYVGTDRESLPRRHHTAPPALLRTSISRYGG